jgi:hypothetical protein
MAPKPCFVAKRQDVPAKCRKSALWLVSGLILIPLLSPPAVQAQRWDPAPLRSPTPLPQDGLPVERNAFLAWLSRNSSRLTPEQGQRVQERLYVYISEMAKRRRGSFPNVADTAAFELFRVAASIGIVGADRLARAVHPDPSKLPAPARIPGFELTLRPPVLALASDDGSWSVCYPYYFMTAPAGRQRPHNGVLTEVAVLSTLFAPDSGPMGSSQATVLLAAAPLADSTRHVRAWLTQLGVSPAPIPREGALGAWYASAASDPMHRLVVVRRLPTRVLVIAYLGYGGTFESNRPHFFDLLSTITHGRCTARNGGAG